MKKARIFPRRTKMTPTDDDAFVGEPPLGCPQYDEVHISVCFTWDISKAKYLESQWKTYAKSVEIGGPAINGSRGDFVPGQYLRKGVTITSRGCPNKCPWCYVPEWEGKIQELPIKEGNIIQDNNLLACSRSHVKKVFAMLRQQKSIEFSGGLQNTLLKDWVVEELRSLKIKQIWVAYDNKMRYRSVRKAIGKLTKYFPRDKIRCYVLIGYYRDSLYEAEMRLRYIYELGALPFAMRYRTPNPNFSGTYLYPEREWNLLTRQWTRPAIIKSMMGKD